MDGGSGSGCACCSCGCGCLVVIIAIIVVIGMIFAFISPMNHDFQNMMPDNFHEFYPEFDDGTSIPSLMGSNLPGYELSETFSCLSTAV